MEQSWATPVPKLANVSFTIWHCAAVSVNHKKMTEDTSKKQEINHTSDR